MDATQTRAGAETLHFSVNDRNDIKRDPSPPPVHTRSTDSHLPTPHQTHEGVQHPNLAVSTRGAIRLITLTSLSLRAHTRRTLAPRGQRTRVRVRRHSPLSPSLPRPLHSPLLSPHDPFKLICPFHSLLLPLSSPSTNSSTMDRDDIVLARLHPQRLSVPFKEHSPYYAILAVLRSKDPKPPDDANIWPSCLLSSLPVVLSRPLSWTNR